MWCKGIQMRAAIIQISFVIGISAAVCSMSPASLVEPCQTLAVSSYPWLHPKAQWNLYSAHCTVMTEGMYVQAVIFCIDLFLQRPGHFVKHAKAWQLSQWAICTNLTVKMFDCTAGPVLLYKHDCLSFSDLASEQDPGVSFVYFLLNFASPTSVLDNMKSSHSAAFLH